MSKVKVFAAQDIKNTTDYITTGTHNMLLIWIKKPPPPLYINHITIHNKTNNQ